jgi:hypothetical protein
LQDYLVALEFWYAQDALACLPSQALNATEKKKYIRTGGLAPNLDIKTYDSGNLHVITLDGTAVTWGKLWVEYDVELYNPQLPPSGAIVFGGQAVAGGVETAANPLGTVPILDPQAIGLSVDALSNMTFQNPGTYLVSTLLTGTVVTGIATVNGPGIVRSTQLAFTVNAAGTVASQSFLIVVSLPNSVLAFSATATTVTAFVVDVAQAPLNSMV